MVSRLFSIILACLLTGLGLSHTRAAVQTDLDPVSRIHIPIGIPDSVDTLKSFVEAEGCFSPGFGSFGVYLWMRDNATGRLYSPAEKEVDCHHGLAEGGLLIPWTTWKAGSISMRSEVCQVECILPKGSIQVAACRVKMTNIRSERQENSLFLAVRPLGPAGWPIRQAAIEGQDSLLIDEHTAVVASSKPQAVGVSDTDEVSNLAFAGAVPGKTEATSPAGNCSGAMRFDIDLPPQASTEISFFCPVLAGRRAVSHQWAPGGKDNFRETAVFNPTEGGYLQPDPGPAWCRTLKINELFDQARDYWSNRVGRVQLTLPDRRWSEAFAAISSHIAMNLNEGAPDVAVVNYTTFNRDGMYNTQILLQAGMSELAAKAIDHLYAHPFNGRPYPEADNPGQILWVTKQYWQFKRDRAWLTGILPKVNQLAGLIQYCRTTPTPHWVDMNSLEFGERVPSERRQLLEPGKCDGYQFNYTEAFDVAGLRAAADLCAGGGQAQEASHWSGLASQLMADYDRKYRAKLGQSYGSYCVLWPCRLYPLDQGPAFDQFHNTGAQPPSEWRYFSFATAHQGLLAGNRSAGHGTLDRHWDHPQMQGWFAFDEGPFSGEGGWKAVRSRWSPIVAMPHGWAVAEIVLLLRDSLVFEDGDCQVLLGGIPVAWLTAPGEMRLQNLPTHHGRLDLCYSFKDGTAHLVLNGSAKPPAGFKLRWPADLEASFRIDGQSAVPNSGGDILLPAGTREAIIKLKH